MIAFKPTDSKDIVSFSLDDMTRFTDLFVNNVEDVYALRSTNAALRLLREYIDLNPEKESDAPRPPITMKSTMDDLTESKFFSAIPSDILFQFITLATELKMDTLKKKLAFVIAINIQDGTKFESDAISANIEKLKKLKEETEEAVLIPKIPNERKDAAVDNDEDYDEDDN